MSYEGQTAWKEIMNHLPKQYHFTEEYMPTEEWWNWQGHQIHLDCFRNKEAKAKVILLHGVGTNGRQMSLITGGPLYKSGYETIALDMPTYGVTKVKKGTVVTYDDWVQAASEYIDVERKRDNRPIFLYGLSAGGMEAYHVACLNKHVAGVIGMTFLDQRIQQVRDETTNNLFWSRIGIPMTTFATKIGLGNFKMKMRVPAKMSALCNDPFMMDIFNQDKTSAANVASMKFLHTYGNYVPAMEAENFDVCPILLTQPEKDRWTPLHLSELHLNKIKKVDITIVQLTNGGHYPVEEALEEMHDAIVDFIEKNR